MNEQQALSQLGNPNLPPEILQGIATQFPQLRPLVACHPSCYPDLARWIAANPGPPRPAPAHTDTASGTGATTRRSGVKLAVLVTVAALVVGLGGFGLWRLLSGGNDSAADVTLARIPRLTTSARLSASPDVPDSPFRFRAVGSQSHLQSGTRTIVAVASPPSGDGATTTTLVALENGTVGFPQWTVVLPNESSQCDLIADVVDCGDSGSYLVETGSPTGTSARSEGSGGTSDSTATSPSAASSDPATGQDSTAQSPPEQPEYPRSLLVGAEVTSDLPFTYTAGVLKNTEKEAVAEFTADRLWALKITPDSGSSAEETDMWAFSDGVELIVTSDGAVAWERTLPEGSASINGFDGDEPNWTSGGDVVVLGEPDGILALKVSDGTEVWRLRATAVESWFLEDSTLFVIADGALHLAEFGLSDAQAGSATEASEGADAIEIPTPPSYADLANGTQRLPAACVEWAWYDGGDFDLEQEFAMVDGVVAISSYEYAQIELQYADVMFLGGRAYTVAQFSCSNGGMYPEQYVGIYDDDRNLVAETPSFYDLELGGYTPKLWADQPTIAGSTFAFTVDGIGLTGDGTATADARSGSATVTWQWDGEELALIDVLYHLPIGDARTPDVAAVQELYDMVSEGTEAGSSQISPQVTARLDTDSLSLGSSEREVIFTPGQQVTECVLAGPENETHDSDGFQFPDLAASGQRYVEPGSFYCGLFRTNPDAAPAMPDGVVDGDTAGIPRIYISWLTVQSDSHGQPTITDTNWAIVGF